MKRIQLAATAVLLCLPLAVLAAGQDELWEVTTQMNMPGLPAGMGGNTQRVCQDKDPRKQVPPGENAEKCKVSDAKQSGNKTSVTVSCPDGTMLIENTYNAARTEYKGTMRMSGSQGDMTMTMSGRKVGSCDASAERAKREQQVAAVQQQVAQGQELMRQQNEMQIRQCAEAVQTMQYGKFGLWGQCRQHGDQCKAMAKDPSTKPVATACMARQGEYCKRYRTEAGFLLAKADRRAAEACGLSVDQVKADLCPGAAKKESLAFLGRYCPVEAKPFAEKHCAGRDFTALRAAGGKGDKYDDFCLAHLSRASLAASPESDEEPQQQGSQQQGSQQQLPNPADAVQEGVTQGINKLRGLFGR
jgi:hypothetical protein